MYLVMEKPVSSLYVGESVQFKAHALCDKSAMGLAGALAQHAVRGASPHAQTQHGTLFLTNFRLLFVSFHGPDEDRGSDRSVQEVVEVHLNNIAEIYECRVPTKLNGSTVAASMSQLEISCKNFEIVKFNFPYELTSG
jgi:hypothetical protein